MTQYQYKARGEDGRCVRGKLQAQDEAELQQKLKERGLLLLRASVQQTEQSGKVLPAKILADFNRELAALTGSGISLVRALTILSERESIRPRERQVCEDLTRAVKKGIALSDAMEELNGVFPMLMVQMIRAAESSGKMEQTCRQLAGYFEKEHKLRSRISSSLLYPKILAGMLVGVMILLVQVILPQFSELFDSMDELPGLTAALMKIALVLKNDGWVILIVVIACIALWKYLMTVRPVRQWYDKCRLHLPLFGKLQKQICTARFARTLSSLYAAGIPIVLALQTARKTMDNRYLDAQFNQVIPLVRAGTPLSEGLEQVDGFVRKLSDTVQVGEETGRLEEMLTHTADGLDYDADIAIGKMVSYVEPIMLLILGAIVAFVMAAVFLGIYESYNSIAGLV
ncbi:MAG: type II secretion system F family protein [Cuneatibacter sp.]|nr:type II secretion system F family protein [Cuneatibacter sp.]